MTYLEPAAKRVRSPTLGLKVRNVSIPSGDIAYVDEGDGPPVLLIHGGPMTSLGFVRVVRALRLHHRVIAPDLPGFGQSRASANFAGSLGEYAKSISEFCGSLKLRGQGGVYGRVRSLPGPVVGRAKVSAFIAAVTPQGATGLVIRECELNGQPAVLVLRDGRPYTAILLSVAGDEIRGVFIHADPARLPQS